MPTSWRAQLADHPVRAAQTLLGAVVVAGPVRARIVEVEAYGSPEGGAWPDPAAHTYPGPTARNRVMFGPAGHLYAYLSYGIHTCVNVTAGPEGEGGGVLLRAAAIDAGIEVVRERRGVCDRDLRLASGPGRLGQALGITLRDNGIDLLDQSSPIRLERNAHAAAFVTGPRIGISKAVDYPWRLWLPEHPAVSRSPRSATMGT